MKRLLLCFLVTIALTGTSLLAQDNHIQLHGFGGWAYGKTNGNIYLSGTPKGNYNSSDLSLHVSGLVGENLRVETQVRFAEASEADVEMDLAYAFAEWKLSDALRIRFGEVKLPFGNYAEVAHVGVLRPFLNTPQGVYGPVGLAGEDSYKGIGITGERVLGKKWRVAYDAYGGGMSIEEFLSPEAFVHGEPVSNETRIEHEQTRNVLGGRVRFLTPVDGLDFGVSAYGGTEVKHDGDTSRWVADLHVQYVADPWLVRSEYAHEMVKNDLKLDAAYLEVGYQLTPHWQVAGQYNHLTTNPFGLDPKQPYPSLLGHREAALGLNYWLSPNMVLKGSVHQVNGNRFAAPEPDQFAEVIPSGGLKTSTRLVQFGVNFSF